MASVRVGVLCSRGLKEIVIIGAGRIGGALAAASPLPCTLVTRDSFYHVDGAGHVDGTAHVDHVDHVDHVWERLRGPPGDPLLVCVRNDDLAAVVERVPVMRHSDLVFVQNGMIDGWLAAHGLADSTRGVLFFAVAKRGGPIEPGGVSPFTGQHAPALADWLLSLGVPAEAVDRRQFAAVMLEKLIWNAAFGLLCERYSVTVGEVLERHAQELTRVTAELNAVGRAALGVTLEDPPLLARLRDFAARIPDNRAGVKEWAWRGGWFVAAAHEHGLTLSTHNRLLAGLPRRPTG